ncbi:hypothetical protein V6N13_053497 [Hibiscus sabdariffa]
MWSLLCSAWCWFVTPPRSVDARCGQFRSRSCRFPCVGLRLFRSHALFATVGTLALLAALLLADPLTLSCAILIRPLAEILSCLLLPLWLRFGGSPHPLPCLAPGLGMVRSLGRLGLAPWRLEQAPPAMAWCAPLAALALPHGG